MVSTLDSESKNPSSNLGRTYDIYVDAGHKEQFWKPAIFLILPTISLIPIGYNKTRYLYTIFIWVSWLGTQFVFFGSSGIRTHAIEMTGAWKHRLRPLGRTTAVISYFGNEETVVLPQQISRSYQY